VTYYLQSDGYVSLKKESAYGTAVTVDTTLSDVHPGDSLQPGVAFNRGTGLRSGRIGPSLNRRVKGRTDPSGDLVADANSVDMAILLEAAFGAVTTGGTEAPYGRLYVPADSAPPSYTIQKVLPLSDGSALEAHTFSGMMCNQLAFALQDDILQVTSSWVGHDMVTDTDAVEPAYASSSNLFTFNSASVGLGGTASAPTATSPSTGATSATNVRELTWQIANNLYTDRFNFGGSGKRSAPVYGQRQVSGSITAEFSATTLRDATLSGDDLALVLTFDGGTNEKLQLVTQHVTLASAIPNAATDMIMLQLDWEANESGTDLLAAALLQNTVAFA